MHIASYSQQLCSGIQNGKSVPSKTVQACVLYYWNLSKKHIITKLQINDMAIKDRELLCNILKNNFRYENRSQS